MMLTLQPPTKLRFIASLLLASLVSSPASATITEQLRGAMKRILPKSAANVPKNHFGQFSHYIPFGSEHIIMLNHPELDPILNAWLEKNVGEARKISDPMERARFLSRRVDRTFRYGRGGILHPFRAKRYRAMIEWGQATLLGDFIKNGTGECRHGACLLQMAYENAGIRSEFTAGRFTQRFLDDGELLQSVGHAWVEAKIGNEFYIFDPIQARHGALLDRWVDRTGESVIWPRRIFLEKSFMTRTRIVYDDIRSFNHIKPLDQSLIEGINFD